MKKIIVSILMLTLAFGAKAQMTAESIMGLMPDMPTLGEMLKYQKDILDPDKDDPNNIFVPFYESLDAAKQQEQAGVQKSYPSVLAQRAMNSKVGNSGYTARDFENMSDAQRQKAGKNMANDMMSGMGLSAADIAKLESGNMTEAEEQASFTFSRRDKENIFFDVKVSYFK